MAGRPEPPLRCASCGAGNPVGTLTCQYCGSALPPPAPIFSPPSLPSENSFELVSPRSSVLSGNSQPLLALGILLIFFGIILLIGAAVVGQGVAQFNQACSQNPLCTPEPDPSGGLAAVGLVLVLIAVILLVVWANRRSD